MGFDIGEAAGGIATNAANGAVGTILGLALEKHEDKRQINQQKKLMDMQNNSQMAMANFNYDQQMKMWDATNYDAQKKQMEKAGLNPALMYGMSGGGGQTTQAAQAQGPDTGKAPSGSGTAAGMGIQMMNLQLLQAQKENIEADTRNKEADTQNKPLQGENIQASTTKLTADTGNVQADTALKEIQLKLDQQQYDTQSASLYDRLDIIKQQARELTGKASQALIQAGVDEATKLTKIDQIKTQLVAQVLTNTLTEIQQQAAKQGIAQSKQSVEQMKQQIAESAQRIVQSKNEVQLNTEMQKYITEPSWNKLWNNLQGATGHAVNTIIKTKTE